MCKFKHCAGPHACFLRDISPCPSRCEDKSAPEDVVERVNTRTRTSGFASYELFEADLSASNSDKAPAERANLGRVKSKVLRAVELLHQRGVA